jgi:hypothetical protein
MDLMLSERTKCSVVRQPTFSIWFLIGNCNRVSCAPVTLICHIAPKGLQNPLLFYVHKSNQFCKTALAHLMFNGLCKKNIDPVRSYLYILCAVVIG